MKKYTILAVDDEPALLEFLRYTLVLLDYTVITATNGVEAFSVFKEHPEIDLVITDVNMPLMDGAALIREVACINPRVQCILMTGRPNQKIIREIQECGIIAALLEKPFIVPQLEQAIVHVLQKGEYIAMAYSRSCAALA